MNLLLRIAIVVIIGAPILHDILDFWEPERTQEVSVRSR